MKLFLIDLVAGFALFAGLFVIVFLLFL